MKLSVKLHKEPAETYSCILTYIFLFRLLLLISKALTITNTCSAFPFDFRVGWINPGMCGAAFSSCCSGLSESLMPLYSSISDSTSALESSSLSFRLSKSPSQFCQFWVSEMLSGGLSSSLATRRQSILLNWRTSNTCFHSPGRFFADETGGKGDLSDNLN